MAAETTRLTIQIAEENADPHELEDLTARLRAELLEIDVATAQAERGAPPPPGARAVLSFTLGGLVVSLAGTELLAAVVTAVTAWLTRDQHRSAKLTIDGDAIELTGVPSGEQRRLTDLWVRRHESARQGGVHAPAGTRSALIVAGDEYRDPGLRRLRAPAHDAEALARVLGDPAIGGFHVRTLLNEPTHVVSEMVEEFFTDRAPDDVLLLHFSCHGVKDDNGELYFATPTTKLNRLGATAVSAEFVSRRMSRSRSRRMILLLDCCYAGAWARGALPRAGMGVHVEEQFGGRGRVVITASNAMEYAFDGTELADAQEQAPSVFTRALVEGLESGDADRDQDGYVGIDELYDYVYDKVRQTTPGQTPGRWAFDLQGDLYVARRARPVTVPSPLPAELQTVIENPIPRVRAGAVEELRRLLRSRHEGLALAARLALQELADDDSRTVSTAAAEALAGGRTAVPASPSGSPPPAPMSQFSHSVPVSPEPEPSESAPPAPSVRAATGEPASSAPTRPADDRAEPVPGVVVAPGEGMPSRSVAPPRTGMSPTTLSPVGQQASSVSATATAASPDPSEGTAGIRNRVLRAFRSRDPALNLRMPALLAAFLLASAALPRLDPIATLWQWLLVAAALGTGLLPPKGRAREITLGFAAGLGAVMLALLAFYADRYSSGWSVWIAVTGTLLIFAVVMLEGAPETTRWSWGGERIVSLVAVAVIAAHLASPDRITYDPGETQQWWGAMVVTVACLCLFIVRGIEQRRDARALVAFVLGAAATVLMLLGLGRAEAITTYLPTLLVMLLLGVRPARGRPEFLAAARLSLIAGVLQGVADHGLSNRVNPTFFIAVVAALLFAIAAYTARRRPSRSSRQE
ncbi:caspase family protein [Microbispora sp. NEAU-D428]|uniref:caspase, EACC1-associated type n=1 Tax=Microbispora sitophila TaxID=2771537 RepID=UPI001865C3ED|nr:caspase family protein [Microbispora sitophila]MBE3010759.1 caspase family protein [Microbispora sitophila]